MAKINGHNFQEEHERESKQAEEKDRAAEGDDDLEGSESGPQPDTEGSETDGPDNAERGVDDVPQLAETRSGEESGLDLPRIINPFAGKELETPMGRIVQNKEVADAVELYVRALQPFAAAGKYPTPPADPSRAHEFTVTRDNKIVLWLVPGYKLCEVQFVFGTEDGIVCRVQETMELASSDRLATTVKNIIAFLEKKRKQRQQGGRLVLH